MKEIKDMNLAELADDLSTLPSCSVRPYVLDTIERLRELHELTRWIPVSERMPTEEDADENGEVLAYDPKAFLPTQVLKWNMITKYKRPTTHWKRITPPEGA